MKKEKRFWCVNCDIVLTSRQLIRDELFCPVCGDRLEVGDFKTEVESHSRTTDPSKTGPSLGHARDENSSYVLKDCPFCSKSLRIRLPIPARIGTCKGCHGRIRIVVDHNSDIHLQRDGTLSLKKSTEKPDTESPNIRVIPITPTESTFGHCQKEVIRAVRSEASSAKVKKISWSWKSLGIAVAISFVMSVIAAGATGGKSAKTMVWTIMWLYLTIEAWKYWKWKALIPYPLFIVASSVLRLIMAGDNAYNMSWPCIIAIIAMNIGGLIVFYVALYKAQVKAEPSTRNAEGAAIYK